MQCTAPTVLLSLPAVPVLLPEPEGPGGRPVVLEQAVVLERAVAATEQRTATTRFAAGFVGRGAARAVDRAAGTAAGKSGMVPGPEAGWSAAGQS